MDGLAATAGILRDADWRVLILTTFEPDAYVYRRCALGPAVSCSVFGTDGEAGVAAEHPLWNDLAPRWKSEFLA